MAPSTDQYATLEGQQAWAHAVMLSRQPDEVLGRDYLRRWYITPRSPFLNVYLHEIRASDEDRALHDHPWDNTSIIIAGSYIEHTPHGRYVRKPGEAIQRSAQELHRLELLNDEPVISLFITGPKIRDWGFACPQGWVHWVDFVANPARAMLPAERVA